ncbi:hypothetical protein, partial [Cecembia rubra]|uniref:hypothetical protein n=1 Tax=Cecembia rubra TaxID=1485585 RepID=UPI001B80BB90
QEACAPLAKTLCALCGKNKSVNTTISPFIPLCGTNSAEKTKSSSKDDCTSELKIRIITSRNCKFQEASAPLAKTLASFAVKTNQSIPQYPHLSRFAELVQRKKPSLQAKMIVQAN